MTWKFSSDLERLSLKGQLFTYLFRSSVRSKVAWLHLISSLLYLSASP